MKVEECIKGLKFLGIAYNKEFDEEECKVYYEFLQSYSYNTFRNAVKSIIKTSKFLPKIAELVEECDKCKEHSRFEILEFMRNQGYFTSASEFDKATMYLEKGIVPDWFKDDMNQYYKLMKQESLGHEEQALLG